MHFKFKKPKENLIVSERNFDKWILRELQLSQVTATYFLFLILRFTFLFFFFLFSIGFGMANFGRFIFFIFAARLLKVVKYKSLPLNTSSSNEIRVKL